MGPCRRRNLPGERNRGWQRGAIDRPNPRRPALVDEPGSHAGIHFGRLRRTEFSFAEGGARHSVRADGKLRKRGWISKSGSRGAASPTMFEHCRSPLISTCGERISLGNGSWLERELIEQGPGGDGI